MKKIIVNKDSRMEVIEESKPKITNSEQVLVKIAYSGLCGSDIPRIFSEGAHFYPITLGHEFSGQIIEIGSDVDDLNVGDNVTCVPLAPCFKCDECQRHYYSLCKNYTFIGSRVSGGLAEYIAVDKRNVFKLPKSVSLKEGAFFEPLTVGMHAILLAGGCENKNVIIVGAGTIGLLAMQCAKAMNAKSITVIDINEERLDLAKELGADFTYNSQKLSAEDILQATHEQRFDQLILETAGANATVLLSIDIAGPRAKLALVGTLHNDFLVPEKTFAYILRKELTIIGSWMNYYNNWPGEEWSKVNEFFTDKKIELNKMIAGVGGFDHFIELVQKLKQKPMNGKLLLEIK